MSRFRYVPAGNEVSSVVVPTTPSAGSNKRTNITANHTVELDDFSVDGVATIENRGTTGTVTVTLPDDDAIPAGAVVWVFKQGVAICNIATASGVTMRYSDGTSGAANAITLSRLYQWARCVKASSTVWDVAVVNPSQVTQTSYLTGDVGRTSTTTYSDTGISLNMEAGGIYAVECSLGFSASADGPGIRIRLNSVSNWADEVYSLLAISDSAGTTYHYADESDSTVNGMQYAQITTLDDSLKPAATISGFVHCNASSDSLLTVQFTQAVSSATTMTMKKGSWMRLTRLN